MPIPTLNRLVARVAGKLPLRTVLIVPFVVQIVGTVGLVGYLSYQSGQKSVEDLAQQLMVQVGERISDRLTTYLQSPQTAVSANHLAVQQGILNINDFKQLRQQFWQQLTLNPSLEALYFGNEAGEEIGYGRFQGEETVKQFEKVTGKDLSIGTPHFFIQRNTDPGKRKYYLVDSKGNPGKLIYTVPLDSHTTPWYRTGKASNQQTWSPISVYKAIPLLGIFAVTPIYNQAGKLQGVFASSFTLSGISTFLDRLDFSPSGQVFIMERSGKLVATSMQESLLVKPTQGEAKQLLGVNSKDTQTRDIAQQLTQKIGNFRTLQTTQQLTLISNHEHQFVRVTPYNDKYGLDWLIVTVVPESDFMEQIHANTRTTIVLCIAALIGSIGVGFITARWITKPIVRLNTAVKNIAKGEWEKTVKINRVDEVGQLGQSFNQMAAQLQQSFAELQSLNESLAQSERRFRTLFEATPKIPVQGYNRYRQVIFWNKASEELYGYTQEEVLGKPLEELIIPHEIWEEVIPAIDAWIAGGSKFPPGELELRRKDGSAVTVYSSYIMLMNVDGEPEMYCVDIDISDRLQAEKLLANYNRTLEVQVAQRTTEITRANELLKWEIAERKLVEGKLYSSTEQVRTIFESITDIVLIIDQKKNIQIIPTKAIGKHSSDTNQLNSIVKQFFQKNKEEIWLPKVQQALETQQTVNFDYSLCINNQDVWFAAKISPLPDRSVVWVARDISDFYKELRLRKLAEDEAHLLLSTTQSISQASDVESALKNILCLICQYINWDFAEAWIPNADGTLGYSSGWCKSDNTLEEFHAASTTFTFAPGRGMPGRIWLSKQPEWIADISDTADSIFYRVQIATNAGLRASFGIPIVENNRVLAVLVFFKRSSSVQEPRIVELVSAVAAQLSALIRRKQIETALYQSEERLKHLLNVTPAIIYSCEPFGVYGVTFVSNNIVRVLGWEAQEFLDDSGLWISCIHPDDKQHVFAQLARLPEENVVCYEYRLLHKNRTYRWLYEEVKLIRDEAGNSVEFVGFAVDITDKKQTELALQASQQRYQTLTEASPVCVFHTAPSGNCTYVNQRWSEITGLSLEETLNLGWVSILHPDDRDRVFAEWSQAVAARVTFQSEYRFLCPDGKIIWVIGQTLPEVGPDGEVIGYVGTVTDISERKLVEQKIRQLSTALENAVEGISRLDTQGRYIAVNKAYANTVGYQPEEMIGMEWQPTVHPDDIEKAITAYQEMLAVGKVEAQIRGIRKDGSMFYKQVVMITAYDAHNNFMGHYCFMKDITERKQAETALQEREEQLQLALEGSGDGFWDWNIETGEVYLSPRYIEMLGYDFDEFPQELNTWDRLIHPDDKPWVMERLNAHLADSSIPYQFDYRVLTKSGTWKWVANYGKVVARDENGIPLRMTGTHRDVSDNKRAEEALRESEQRYLAIIEDQTELIARFRPDGTLSFINEAYCRYFGLTREQLLGHRFEPLIVEEDREHLNRLINSLSIENPVVTIEHRVIVAGEVRWTQWINRALFDEQGRLIKVQAVGRDITDKKRAEEALREIAQRENAIATVIQRMRQTLDIDTIFSATTEELRQVMKCDRVVVYQFNSDWSGQFVSESVGDGWISLMQQQINPNADEQLLNDPSCTLKTTMLSGTPEPLVDSYMQETKGGAYSKGINYRVIQDIYQAGFTQCYLELLERFQIRAYILIPIYCNNQLWGLLATYQNSDSRTWSEAEIITVVQIGIQLGFALQQAQLLQQTQHQAIQLQQAAYAAETANQAKSTFLANMSHELRTPLNAILGFAQLMANSPLLPEQQERVKIINRSGEHLLTLINDVLDLAKIEAKRTTLNEQDFNLYKLLADVEQMFCLKAQTKGVQLTIDRDDTVPNYVRTDEVKLRQVLLNLLSNAIKFTEEGGVSLKVKSQKSKVKREVGGDSCLLTFEVSDTGAGIAPEELDSIFESFVQSQTGKQSVEGTGLGLPISRAFVQLMGGDITVRSVVGEGSTFSFAIPVTVVESTLLTTQQPSRRVIALEPNQPRYRILVVDDKSDNRQLLMQLLSPLGFALKGASNGQEAIEIWEDFEPHLIFMDLRMPVMDGYEAAKQIKSTAIGQATAILAVSASAVNLDRVTIKDTNFDDFIRKPFREAEIFEAMSQHLGVRFAYEELNQVSHTPPTEVTAVKVDDLAELSADLVANLYQVTLEGDFAVMLTLIEEIRSQNDSLASVLADLTNNFQFQELLDLLEPLI